MKSLLTALSLAALSLVAGAAAYAQDFGGVDERVALGTVQHVKVVQVERDIHAFDERAFELSSQPDLTEQLVIRLDAGDIVTVTVQGAQRFAPGERVRVVSQTYSPYGPQVEHQ
jgi:outer membrane lipoprotein SlyB